MKTFLAAKSLRSVLMLIPLILVSSIVVQSCNLTSVFQTLTSTPIIGSTLTASPALTFFPPFTNVSTQTPTPGPFALQLQAVLNAVAARLSHCREIRQNNGVPAVKLETGPEGPGASFSCRSSADSGYSVSISSSDQDVIPDDRFTAEQANDGGTCFHGYILYEEFLRNPHRHSAVQSVQEWHAQRWVISVRAFYDPAYIHYSAQEVSEAVYKFGVEQGLFPTGACP